MTIGKHPSPICQAAAGIGGSGTGSRLRQHGAERKAERAGQRHRDARQLFGRGR